MQFAAIVKPLKRDHDYEVDEAKRTVVPTEVGVTAVEKALGVENLYENVNQNFVHQLQAALRAKELFKRDVDYVVQGGEVKIVDEFTGRILEGRRWSEGLHQAVEAKERVKIKEENQTLATITLQNYFRMYDKLSGHDRHRVHRGRRVRPHLRARGGVDPHQPLDGPPRRARPHLQDRGREVRRRWPTTSPSATATASRCWSAPSRSRSRSSSRACSRSGASPHEVLNAKQHEREAHIVTQAGRLGAVTVATNMAGRGVDILLGGNPEGLATQELLASGTTIEESPEKYAELVEQLKVECAGSRRRGARARRALRARHRTPREPPHRQPAARSVGPPGRPGGEPLLPLARRRAHAPLRHRRHELGDGQGLPRRHAARGEDGHQGHRARAAHGRGPQLRDPQGRPQVRRGDERAAEGHLPPPPADPRRR